MVCHRVVRQGALSLKSFVAFCDTAFEVIFFVFRVFVLLMVGQKSLIGKNIVGWLIAKVASKISSVDHSYVPSFLYKAAELGATATIFVHYLVPSQVSVVIRHLPISFELPPTIFTSLFLTF